MYGITLLYNIELVKKYETVDERHAVQSIVDSLLSKPLIDERERERLKMGEAERRLADAKSARSTLATNMELRHQKVSLDI